MSRSFESQHITSRNPLEAELTSIWQDVLELPEVGIHDDFFDLGGHSLLAIELRARVRKALSAPLLQVDLLNTPTIASMAESIFSKLAGVLPQEK
jgi:hypothetical protein